MRRRRILLGLSCLVYAGVVPAIAGTSTAASPWPTVTTGTSEKPPPTPPPSTAVNSVDESGGDGLLPFEEPRARVQELATANGALDVGVDTAAGEMVVRLDASDVTGRLREGPLREADVPARVERSRWTREYIDSARTALAERGWHDRAPSYNYGFFYDAAEDRIALNTNAPADVVEPLLSRFSPLIDYTYSEKIGRRSRIADNDPFWGAALTQNVDGYWFCSTGFTVQNSSGGRAMTTASHCGDLYDDFWNGNGTQFVGELRGKPPFPQRDFAFLTRGESYGPYIYVGDFTGSGRPVSGAGDPALGYGYCTSGYYSLTFCGNTVVSLDSTYCGTGGCTYHLIAYRPECLCSGDSGMPLFAYESDHWHLHIRGLFIADAGDFSFAEKYSLIKGYGWTAVTTR